MSCNQDGHLAGMVMANAYNPQLHKRFQATLDYMEPVSKQNATQHSISILKSVFSAIRITEISAWHKPVISVPGRLGKGTER